MAIENLGKTRYLNTMHSNNCNAHSQERFLCSFNSMFWS